MSETNGNAVAAKRPQFKEPKQARSVETPQEFDDSGVHEDMYPSPLWTTPGEQVYGTYVGEKRLALADADGKKKQRTMFLIREDSGRTISVWDTKVLLDQMAIKMPQPGDRIIIVNQGLGNAKVGLHAPHILRVGVKRRIAEVAAK